MVHDQERVDPIVKFYQLNEALKGEAIDAIKHLSVIPDNYLEAWKLLREHYENKRRLINLVIGNFLSTPNMKTDSYKELKNLHNISLDCLKNLESFNRAVEKTGEDFFVFYVVNRFDQVTRKEWEKKLGKSTTRHS